LQGLGGCGPLTSAILIPNDQKGNAFYCGGYLSPLAGDTMSGVIRGNHVWLDSLKV